ncbi:7849_t:CDS:2, partial [Ambispora leptoticha]
LKEILKENRVDFSGIVEKSELVLKVNRIVEATKEELATDVDALSDDALCKICCDAVQNCVVLDCGHMSTCMDCGKKMQEARNECPICRETIVKLIRVYRA